MRIAPLLVLFTIGCGNDSGLPPTDPPAEPVYYGQVERILRDNCIECHGNAPERLAPFSLDGYEHVLAAAEAAPIAFAVMNRSMPPYYANNDGSCQTFHDTKWLTDDEIATVVAWTNGGRLEGDPADAVAPAPEPAELPSIDKTIDTGVDYLPIGPADDFRCFVIDPIGTADQFLTGVHVRPSNLTVAHHVIVFSLDDAAAEADVEARDAADPGPGYACQNGVGEGASFLTGWAPGQRATLYPQDTGLPVAGNRKLVIQMHYNSANANGLPDRTAIDLDLAPTVAKQARIISVRGDVDLPPREVDTTAIGTRVLTTPNNIPTGRVWGAMTHMHTRGISAQVHVERSTDACLLDLDGWDFHWQHFYWYAQPFTVNRNETIRVTCHYDTSNETRNVTWGEGTGDEMCIAYLYVSL